MRLACLLSAPRVLIAAAGAFSLGLVLGGVALAQTLNLAACPLCILQRMLYLLLACETLVLLPWARGAGIRALAVLMALTSATGAWIAGYQTWLQRFAQGVSTRWRPAIETWEVMRAPLVPIGSLATCTMISCPSRSTVSMFGTERFAWRPRPRRGRGSSSSSSGSR